jgi:hypothetical protein
MSDNILSAVLTFSLLAAGTAAIGTEMFNARQSAAAPASTKVVMLPAVTVIGHREAATEVVMLPAVTVIGRRAPVDVACAQGAVRL